MGPSPHIGQAGPRVNLADTTSLENGLRDIHGDIEAILELAENYQRTRSFTDHMRLVFAMSGLEIKMTNFAVDLRETLK